MKTLSIIALTAVASIYWAPSLDACPTKDCVEFASASKDCDVKLTYDLYLKASACDFDLDSASKLDAKLDGLKRDDLTFSKTTKDSKDAKDLDFEIDLGKFDCGCKSGDGCDATRDSLLKATFELI